MAKKKPTTKAGKQRKVKKVLGEAKRGTLRTSAGRKPTSRAQEIAIAMSEAGIKKKPKRSRK